MNNNRGQGEIKFQRLTLIGEGLKKAIAHHTEVEEGKEGKEGKE